MAYTACPSKASSFFAPGKSFTTASVCCARFEAKWIRAGAADPLGSPDIQSLSDLANSHAVIERLRPLLFPLGIVAVVAACAAAPLHGIETAVKAL